MPHHPGIAAKIIVLKEEQPGERRVALTPRASADLVARGMRVWVESGAGSRAGYQDEVYIKAGATITATRSELFQDADVIAWVKPPSDLDRVLSHLPLGCTIVGFTHPLHDDTVAHRAHRENLRVQSVELLAQEEILPAQDALAAMSRFAGRIALEEALDLRRELGHRGPQNILVIGAGHAGMQAAQLASVLGTASLSHPPGSDTAGRWSNCSERLTTTSMVPRGTWPVCSASSRSSLESSRSIDPT